MALNANEEIERIRKAENRVSDKITAFAGTMRFVYIHSVWFGLWIAINLGLLGAALIFDEYPFGLLTLIVSLEAIFLSTFVMISQNRQAKSAEIRSNLDYKTNVMAERDRYHHASSATYGRKAGDRIWRLSHRSRIIAQDDGCKWVMEGSSAETRSPSCSG